MTIQGAFQQVFRFHVTPFFFFPPNTALQSFRFLGMDKTLDFCLKLDHHLFNHHFSSLNFKKAKPLG